MPPRLTSAFNIPKPTAIFAVSARNASILSSLSDTKGAYNKRIRRGRGPSSGKGKTSGRGHKGQKQHGKVPAHFEGGQTPLHVVKGERGFENLFAIQLSKVNLDRLQAWIDAGRLDPTKPITLKELHSSRCTHGIKDGVKLLARNADELRTPIDITVSRASATAIAAIEAQGGKVTTRYYTRPSIKRIIAGETHPTLSLLSLPPPHLRSPSPSDADPTLNATSSAQPIGASAMVYSPSERTNFSATFTIPSKPKNLAKNDNPLLAEILKYKYRLPDPASRKDLEYYRDPAHRGYLSYQLKNKATPSLFFQPHLYGGRGVTAAFLRRRKSKNAAAAKKPTVEDAKMW